MSDIIKVLPDSVASQIKAGEVIQQPSSVIKELVENSIDAGASEIEIIIKDAGRTLIQVIDNGQGMSARDARMAFEQHATSKIKNADDLLSLHTMGFRGEALASIAAIARVELRTKKPDDSIGTKLIINGAKVESQEAEMCPSGSNMMVKNLFFNVPARRKFLKKDSTELAGILREFERLALVNPTVEFSISHNDSLLHRLRSGSLKQRVTDLFGIGLEKQLVPVETSTSIVTLNGFVSLPEYSRKRNRLQYLFVNGRNIRHPYFHKAIMLCYENLIPADEQPNYFLNLTVDPDSIDVNVHPTKNEVKFENESSIWQIIVAAVKESLGSFNAMPSIDFSDDVRQMPVFNPMANRKYPEETDRSYNPFTQGNGRNRPENPLKQLGADWNRLYEEFTSDPSYRKESESSDTLISSKLNNTDNGESAEGQSEQMSVLFSSPDNVGSTSCLAIKGKYIAIQSKDGLMLIDQRRAHVRVLFDRYFSQIEKNDIHSQRLMFPEILALSPAENSILKSILPELNKIGFELTSLGGSDWNVTGCPSVLKDENPIDVLNKIISDQTENEIGTSEGIISKVALSMAKASAVGHGTILSDSEMEHLVSQLFSRPVSKYTPDGQTIIVTIDLESIGRMFE